MGYNMKRGSSPNFKELGSSTAQVEDSPTKIIAKTVLDKVPGAGGLTGLARGYESGGVLGGITGSVTGSLGLTSGVDRETLDSESQYQDVLKSEGLERNFWGKLGFGGGKSKERAARIAELQEQDQMGIDRDRIEARGGSVAGPS